MRSILIVEDDVTFRSLLTQNAFNEKEWGIREAEDGEAALRLIDDKLPDVLLLDMMLPKLDGFDVLRELKKKGLREKMKVIVMTGSASVIDMMAQDVDAALFKPFNLSKLEETVNRVFEV